MEDDKQSVDGSPGASVPAHERLGNHALKGETQSLPGDSKGHDENGTKRCMQDDSTGAHGCTDQPQNDLNHMSPTSMHDAPAYDSHAAHASHASKGADMIACNGKACSTEPSKAADRHHSNELRMHGSAEDRMQSSQAGHAKDTRDDSHRRSRHTSRRDSRHDSRGDSRHDSRDDSNGRGRAYQKHGSERHSRDDRREHGRENSTHKSRDHGTSHGSHDSSRDDDRKHSRSHSRDGSRNHGKQSHVKEARQEHHHEKNRSKSASPHSPTHDHKHRHTGRSRSRSRSRSKSCSRSQSRRSHTHHSSSGQEGRDSDHANGSKHSRSRHHDSREHDVTAKKQKRQSPEQHEAGPLPPPPQLPPPPPLPHAPHQVPVAVLHSAGSHDSGNGSGSGGSSECIAVAEAASADAQGSQDAAGAGKPDVHKAAATAAAAAPADKAGVAAAAAPVKKSLLSFGDEVEDLEGGSEAPFSLAASTAVRFNKERSMPRTPSLPRPLPPSTASTAPATAATTAASLQLHDPCIIDGSSTAATAADSSPSTSGRTTLSRVVFGVASARNARPYMEDRHCIVTALRPLSAAGLPITDGVERSFASIYDGHNGSRAAEVAAARLHKILAADSALRTHSGCLGPPSMQIAEEAAISTALKKAFRDVDNDILSQARADGGRDGATALVVTRLGDALYAAHAGDSRAVLCRKGGAAERLTEDHKPQRPAERSRVEAAGGRVEFQRCWRVVVEPRDGRPGSGLAVSRSLGDLDFKEPRRFVESEPDVKRLVPRPGDAFVVLASDGLWDVMSDQDAVDCASQVLQASEGYASGNLSTSDAVAAAESLLNTSIKRGTVDNVTVIVMLLGWD